MSRPDPIPLARFLNDWYPSDFASVINRIVEEWAEFPEFQLPEQFAVNSK